MKHIPLDLEKAFTCAGCGCRILLTVRDPLPVTWGVAVKTIARGRGTEYQYWYTCGECREVAA